MTILLGLAAAVLFAAFGVLFLASAKAESWIALVIFIACGIVVLTVPVGTWLREVADEQNLIVIAAVGFIGGGVCLWALHRAGMTERLTQILSKSKTTHTEP